MFTKKSSKNTSICTRANTTIRWTFASASVQPRLIRFCSPYYRALQLDPHGCQFDPISSCPKLFASPIDLLATAVSASRNGGAFSGRTQPARHPHR